MIIKIWKWLNCQDETYEAKRRKRVQQDGAKFAADMIDRGYAPEEIITLARRSFGSSAHNSWFSEGVIMEAKEANEGPED